VVNFGEILVREGERLLLIEKDRRGVDRDELVFVGMADTASYWWCAMKSLFSNRMMELNFFLSYLEDRISYSFRLGLIDRLPENVERWLDIGDNIKFEDVEKLLLEEESVWLKIPGIFWFSDGRGVIFVVNLKCSREMVDAAIAELKRKYGDENVFITDIEKEPERLGLIWRLNPRDRGQILQMLFSEVYPTIRWNFTWDKYIIVGVPDGITDNFVYEFKTTSSEFLMRMQRPVFFTQGDFYGYFFRRPKKRIQVLVKGDIEARTWMENVDASNAIDTLKKFKEVDEGGEVKPPKSWKCKRCEFREKCPIRHLK